MFGLLAGCSASDDIPAPMIASIVPDNGAPGEVVTLSGDYFCQQPPVDDGDPTCDISGTVVFGTVPGTPSTWSDVTIMIEVPQGVTGHADVTVTAAGRTSNSVGFTVN